MTSRLPRVTRTLDLCSLAILASLRFVHLAPMKWNLHYPGGRYSFSMALWSPMPMSALAGRWGNHLWFFLTAAALATFVYMGLHLFAGILVLMTGGAC